MAATEASVLAPVIVMAALVIRTAIAEIRQPGSARQQWAFTTDSRAMTAGVLVALATAGIGSHHVGWAAVAWAVLTGALTAFMVGQTTHH